jgi:hypothetical protein
LLWVNRERLITLRRQQVELAEIVERAVESSRPLIEERRHELVESMPPVRAGQTTFMPCWTKS